MLFNSLEFVVFFAILFILYRWVLNGKTKAQNFLLLAASYVFYGYVDWKILPLLILSTVLFYGLGMAISTAKTARRNSLYSTLGVVFGIAVLGYFKYTNFFIGSFQELFEHLGFQVHRYTFQIGVPVGISFYTFRLLSYVIDVHRGKYEPTRDFTVFATYVAFFPSILSGPIDRPNTLIPQLQKPHMFDYPLFVDGLRQILWGMFKKMVIADQCAVVVNAVFADPAQYSGSTLV
ncbi:MAG: MBOAT family protein, partial [Dysgonamonadaceae bacterium]|nr:MBOAT family protein [Dysgonamonadaceae bacterium]